MRWPSGPNANKTRPHFGSFLHIRTYSTLDPIFGHFCISEPIQILNSYGDTHTQSGENSPSNGMHMCNGTTTKITTLDTYI